MSTISAADVKKLRDLTGAGMMDCKKALVESNGNMDEAVDFLRKKGAKVAAMRAGRDAKEGSVCIMHNADNTKAFMLLMSCETDFVAKNESFVEFTSEITKLALDNNIDTKEALMDANIDGMKVSEKIVEKIGTIGENIDIKEFQTIEGDLVSSYNHNTRAGAIVSMSKSGEALAALGKDLAMQAVAMRPEALDETSVSQEQKDREVAIAKEKAIADGKPENIVEKIAEGSLKKFYKERTLMGQEFIKDTKKTVGQVVKETDADVKVNAFKAIYLS